MVRHVFNDMTQEFFVCQKSYGDTTQIIFFSQKINFQLGFQAKQGMQIKKLFDTIKDHPK